MGEPVRSNIEHVANLVKEENTIVEERCLRMNSNSGGGFAYAKKVEPRKDGAILDDYNYVLLKNEMSVLRSMVEKISFMVSNSCNKSEIHDLRNQLLAMHREVAKLRNFVIGSFGVFGNSNWHRNKMSPNSATVNGGPSTVNFSNNTTDSSGVRGKGCETPEKMFANRSATGESTKKREGKYNNKRKGVEKTPILVEKSKTARLLFDSTYEKRSPPTPPNLGIRNVATFRSGPFVLESALLEADVRLLEYLFSNELNPTEIVVDMEFNELRRGEIKSLMPGVYVDGEILATVCEMLMKESIINGDGVCLDAYVPPHYSDVALSKVGDWIGFIDAHHLKERYLLRLMSCNTAFFPILDSRKAHWFLLVVDVINRKAEIWYSSPSDGGNEARIAMGSFVLQSIDEVLEKEIQGDGNKEIPFFGTFTVSPRVDAPRQSNSFDCGMYVVAYMQNRFATLRPDFVVAQLPDIWMKI